MVGIFPDRPAPIRLAGAVLVERRMFVEGDEGLEPAMLWLTETGMPMAYKSWTKVFERASERCERAGLKVYATPKMLRHSMALRVLVSLHHALDRRLGLTAAQRRDYEDAYGTVWTMVKDLLGHRSEVTTREIYLEPVRGLQIESLLPRQEMPSKAVPTPLLRLSCHTPT